MDYRFYSNSKSEHGEIHIYENGERSPLCDSGQRIDIQDGLPVGIFLGNEIFKQDFEKKATRTFATFLENNNIPVCGRCISKLYHTQPNQKLLSNYFTDR